MPRLSNYDYLLIQAHLHHIWMTRRHGFSLISTKDQRHLHDFFRPSETLTEAELLAHRKAVTTKYPNLPHQAGRASKHLADPLPLKHARAGNQRIVVYSLLKPQPDIPRLARALMNTARRIAEDRLNE